MIFRLAIILLIGFVTFTGCKRTDDIAPILTLNGDSLVNHPLNAEYIDAGASAQDDTDGDISKTIFVDNPVEVDRIGEYLISYTVVDQGGNEAAPVYRTVQVYNQAEVYEGTFSIREAEVPPGQIICDSVTTVRVDSNFNYRLVLNDFQCSSGYEAYFDVYDTLVVMPFQIISDSILTVSLQGSGLITDSTITFGYKRTSNSVSSYWEVLLQRKE